MKARWVLLVVCLVACGRTSSQKSDLGPTTDARIDGIVDSAPTDQADAAPRVDEPSIVPDSSGSTCGYCADGYTCDEDAGECVTPGCPPDLFNEDVCGVGENVKPACGQCLEGEWHSCMHIEGVGEDALFTFCECEEGETAFHCNWRRTIPGTTPCGPGFDDVACSCSGSCHPHATSYCKGSCKAHSECEDDFYCGGGHSVNWWDDSAHGFCIPKGYVGCGYGCGLPGYLWDGCPCKTDEDCTNEYGSVSPGHCIPSRHGRTCGMSHCIDMCPTYLLCAQVGSFPDDFGYECVDPLIIEGMPCRTNNDCRYPWHGLEGKPDGICVMQGTDGAFCVSTFTLEDSPLPQTISTNCLSGGDCALLEGHPIPEDFLECPWYHVEVQAETDCAVTNEYGTCLGKRRCSEAGLTDCDAQTPAPEACGDGIDEDCDGETDEGCIF